MFYDFTFRRFCIMYQSPRERLHNLQPKASQTLHAYTETNPIVFISNIIAPRDMIDSEIMSNRWQSHLVVQQSPQLVVVVVVGSRSRSRSRNRSRSRSRNRSRSRSHTVGICP